MYVPAVYADGYGRWHALIPESVGRGATLVLMAEHLIAAKLEVRGNDDTDYLGYVCLNIQLDGVQDKPGFIHFVEYHLDEDKA